MDEKTITEMLVELRDLSGRLYSHLKGEDMSARMIKNDIIVMMQKRDVLSKEISAFENMLLHKKMEGEDIIKAAHEKAREIEEIAARNLADATQKQQLANEEYKKAKDASYIAKKVKAA